MTGIIVLAAGGSTRLGKPKQLLAYKGQTLLAIAVEAAIESGGKPVVVVAGAYESKVLKELDAEQIYIAKNDGWIEGMASSIKTGLHRVLELAPAIEQVLIMLCDQPHVNADLLKSMVEAKDKSQKGIAAAFYKNTSGAPVLFDKKYFDDLLSLNGQEGAKKLLIKYSTDITTVPFPLGAIDIDTIEDYEKLVS